MKERLRNSRDEAVSQLRIERERNVKLCGMLQEYERMSVWNFLRRKLVRTIGTIAK